MSPDLMHSAEIKDLVREAYRNVPASTAAVAYKLYTAEDLAQVPALAINRALGVANHLRFADIQPGETILDVGCGVINLSPRKARVMAECARVLCPGGRLCVSDLTVQQDQLPPEILTQPAAWAGCIAGALAERDLIYKLQKAGFTDVQGRH